MRYEKLDKFATFQKKARKCSYIFHTTISRDLSIIMKKLKSGLTVKSWKAYRSSLSNIELKNQIKFQYEILSNSSVP